jgi:WD40 repeat protein
MSALSLELVLCIPIVAVGIALPAIIGARCGKRPALAQALFLLLSLPLLTQADEGIVSESSLDPESQERDASKATPSATVNKDANVSAVDPRGEQLIFENGSVEIQPLGSTLWSATMSPDGKIIATGEAEFQGHAALRIWDRESGKVKLSIPHGKGIRSVAFSPDGNVLASGSFDGFVRFYDTKTFALFASGDETSGGHKPTGINCVSFFKGGKYLATAGFDKSIRVWDVTAIVAARKASGTIRVSPVAILEGHTQRVLTVAGSADGKTILSGSQDATGRVWDLPATLPKMGERPVVITKESVLLGGGAQAVEVPGGRAQAVEGIAISPDGQHVATGTWGGTLQVRDRTGTMFELTSQFDTGVMCAAFSGDGKYLAAGCGNRFIPNPKEVRVWDMTTKMEVARRGDFAEGVKSLEFSPDGKTLVAAIENQTVHVWQWGENKDKQTLTPSSVGFTRQPLLAGAVSPDGSLLAFSGEAKSVFVYNRSTNKLVVELTGHDDVIAGLGFSPDGKRLASASYDKSIKLWDTQSWKELRSLAGHTGWVFGVAFSPDSGTLASGSYDKTIRIWDAQTGEAKAVWKEHSAGIRSIAFSPDGKKLVSGGSDRVLRLWDVAEGKVLHALKGHKNAIRSVAYSPDGKSVASGAEDQTVKTWDVETGKETHTFSGLPDIVTSIGYSPKGQTLVAATLQGPILILDPFSHRTRQTLYAHNEAVSTVLFADGGQHLMSVSLDSSIRQWALAKTALATPLSTLSGKLGVVTKAAMTPNGNSAVFGTIDGSIVVWDLKTDALRTFAGNHPAGIAHIAATDELTVASVDMDGTFRVSSQDGSETWKGKGTFAAFTPNGKQLAVADGKDVVLYDAATGKELKRFADGHDGNVVRLDFNPDGTRMISAGKNTKVRLWNVSTGRKLQETTAFGNESSITHLAFSTDGTRFVAAAFGPDQALDDMTGNFQPIREARIFTVPTNPEAAFANPLTIRNQPNDQPLAGIHWTANGVGLVITSLNGMVRLVELNTTGVNERQRFNAHNSAIMASSVSVAGGVFITAGEDQAVRRWKLPAVDPTPGQARLISAGLTRVWEALPSPDGKYVVTAGEGDKTFRVYANTPSVIPVEADNYPAVMSLAFSPDNRFLVTGHSKGILVVRDAATGKPLRTVTGFAKVISSIAFAEKGATLIAAGGNTNNGKEPGEAIVFDFPEGTIRHKLNAPALQTMIAVHPDGKSAAISSADGKVRVWDLKSGKLLNTFGKGGPSLKVVAYNSTGDRIAAGGFDHAVRIWDTLTGTELRSISTEPLLPTKALFSPDGKEIVISAWAGGGNQQANKPSITAYSIDNPSAAPRDFAVPTAASVMGLAFLPDRKTLIASTGETGTGGALKEFDYATGRFLGEFGRHRHWAQTVAVSPDGTKLASTSWALWATGELRLWETRGFRPIAEVRVPDENHYTSSAAISRDGKLLVLGGWGSTLTAWDMSDPAHPAPRKQFRDHKAPLRSVSFDSAGTRFVSTDESGVVKVWDAANLELIVSFRASDNAIYRARFTPDGTALVTVSGKHTAGAVGEMRVWDPKTGGEVGRFPDQAREVWDFVFLNGGKHMAALHTFTGAPDDASVKIWDFETKQVVKTLLPPGTFKGGRCLDVSPDGKYLAIGSSDGPVKVLETASWQEVLSLPTLTNCTFRVNFTPSGENLLIASGEGAAIFVRIPSAK